MSTEKKCKYCAMMIPKEAKFCPHCRKRQKMRLFTKILIGFFLFFVFCMLLGEISNRSKYKSSSQQTQQQKTKKSPSSDQPRRPAEIALTVEGKTVKGDHPQWSNRVCNAVAKKAVFVGMTRDQAIAAWGKPYKINSTSYSHVENEQWVMSEYGNDYLYFEDGILTAVQTSRSGE